MGMANHEIKHTKCYYNKLPHIVINTIISIISANKNFENCEELRLLTITVLCNVAGVLSGPSAEFDTAVPWKSQRVCGHC